MSRTGRLVTSANVYAEVAEWTVAAGRTGDLHEVSMFTNNFGATQFRLTIGGVQQWTDRVLGTSLTASWRSNRLPEATQVLLEARSPDGATEVTADGSISGTER